MSAARYEYFSQRILEQVEAGNGGREILKEACREMGMTEQEQGCVFHPWGGALRELAEEGLISYRVGTQKEFQRNAPFIPVTYVQALQTLLTRYFTHYGPATLRDASYFFGLPQGELKRHLGALDLRETSEGARTRYWIETPKTAQELPVDCLFLAGFDPLLLGYNKTESLFLPPEHLRGVFNKTGIVFPTLLLDGRVVAKWKKEKQSLTLTPFEPIPAAKKNRMERAAKGLWDPIREIRWTR